MSRQVWSMVAIGAVFVIVRCVTVMPRAFTSDEQRSFGAALLTFDPYSHQPPPPSYPVYVAAAKFLNVFIRRPLPTLLTLSLLSAVGGFVLFSLAFVERIGVFGVAAALAIYIAPPMRFLCANATPEPLALALFAGAVWLSARSSWRFAILAGLAVGARPQMLFAVAAFCVCASLRQSERLKPVLTLIGTVALCFVPVLQNVGVDRFSVFAASISFGHGAPLRDFLLQPWWKATPLVLLLAVAGFVRSRDLPLAAFTIVHLAYAATIGASNESVRPFVPGLAGIAFFAVAAVLYHGRRGPALHLADRADVQRRSEH